jgi:hypothetical protein
MPINGTINGIGVSTENTGLDIINNQIALTNNNILNPVTIRGIFEGYGPETNPIQSNGSFITVFILGELLT